MTNGLNFKFHIILYVANLITVWICFSYWLDSPPEVSPQNQKKKNGLSSLLRITKQWMLLFGEERWNAPPLGTLKLNFDVAVLEQEGFIGVRIIIRNDNGEVIASILDWEIFTWETEYLIQDAKENMAISSTSLVCRLGAEKWCSPPLGKFKLNSVWCCPFCEGAIIWNNGREIIASTSGKFSGITDPFYSECFALV